MKKAFTKTLSVFLAVLMSVSAFTAVCPAVASAQSSVNYPSRAATNDDYARNMTYYTSQATMQEVIDRLDGVLLGTDFKNLTEMPATLDTTISNLISENLYNDKVITDMIKLIYPMICDMIHQAIQDNANIVLWTWPWGGDVSIDLRDYADGIASSLIDDFGLYIYPVYLADAIARIDSGRFSQVINAFRNAGKDWNSVNWDNLQWNINDRDSWVKGLGCVLSGLMPAMRAILQNVYYEHEEDALTVGTVDLEIWLEATANPGYNNAILPLLETLCGNLPVSYYYNGVHYTGLMSNAEYCNISDPVGMAAHIAYPIFTMVENTAATAPIETVTKILPQLCYALYNNMLYSWLNGLQTKCTFKMKAYGNMVNKEIVKQDIPLNVWDLSSSMFDGVNIRSLSGVANFMLNTMGMSISIPEADTRYIAELGTNSSFPSGRTRVNADSPGVLLYLLRFFGQMCSSGNAASLIAAFTGGAAVPEFLLQAIEKIGANPDEAICAVVELCCPQNYAMTETFNAQKIASIPVQTVTYSEYWSKADAEVVSSDFDSFLNTALSSLTGETVGDILRGAIGSSLFTNSLLNTIVISMRGLLSGFEKPLNLLQINLSSWNTVTEDTNWGFTDGDKSGFTNALVNVLSPFNSLLRMLLADGDVNIMNNNLTVLGYEGYAYGVIPLLEALGCRSQDIVSPAQYINDVQADNGTVIKDIVVPVLNLLERIYNEPVATTLEILPNILYFIETGAFETSVKNTLQSIFVLLDNIRPLMDLGIYFDLSFEGIVSLVSSMLSGDSSTSFVNELINKLDIAPLLQGSVQTAVSANGTTRYFIAGSDSDSLTAILRAALALIFTGDNEEAVEYALISSFSPDAQTHSIISAVITGLNNMYAEENGADKILSVIYYLYSMGGDLLNGDFSVVADLLNRWDYISEALGSEENEYIVSFLGTVLEGFRDGTNNTTNTQSTNIENAYFVSSTLGVRNATDGVSFADTLTKYSPSSFTNTYSLTHQTGTSSTASLFVDKSKTDITDISESGMHLSAALNAYSGNGVAMSVSLLPSDADIAAINDTVALMSANGEMLTYTLNDSAYLLGSASETDNTVATGEAVKLLGLRSINGALPATGDSAAVRIALQTKVTGTDGAEYINVSYINLSIYTVDKTALKNTIALYASAENAYTAASYSAYADALAKAKAVLSDKTATQPEIEAASAALSSAHSALALSETITAAVENAYSMLPVTNANYLTVKEALDTAAAAFAENNTAVTLCNDEATDRYEEARAAYSDYVRTLGADAFTPATVTYPERTPLANDTARTALEGYQTNEASFGVLLTKVDEILASSDFASLTGMKKPLGTSLADTITNALCNDSVVTALVKLLYPTISGLITDAIGSAAAVELFGQTVDLSSLLNDIARDMLSEYSLALYPKDLATVLENADSSKYSANIRALRDAGDSWDNVNFNSFSWRVYDMDSLLSALGAALGGVKPVFTALLTETGYAHSDTVYSLLSLANLDLSLSATACGGYDKVILPILEIICPNGVSYTYKGTTYGSLMSPADYCALTDTADMLAHIVCPVFAGLETALNTAPAEYITTLLPNLTAVLRFGIPEDMLNALSTIIGFDISVDAYGTLINQKLELSLGNLLSQYLPIDLTDINALLALASDALGIEGGLPEINAVRLSSLGTIEQTQSATSRGTRYIVNSNNAAVLSLVLGYAASLVSNEEVMSALSSLLGFDLSGDELVSSVLGKLESDPAGVISALNELAVPSSGYGYQNLYTGTAAVKTVGYTKYWTAANAKDVAGNIDGFINQITTLFGSQPVGTLIDNALSNGLYTNKNVSAAVMAIRDVITSVDASGTILKVLRLDLSSYIPVTSETDWGFTDGDKNGFINAMVTVLRPLYPLLDNLLANGDLGLLNYIVNLKGSAGYKNGVLPVLEALGCENLVTASQYTSDIRENTDALLTDILNPVLTLLEKVYASPVETLLDILPNAAYFIECGAADNAVQNILHTVYVLLDTVRPVYDVSFSLNLSEILGKLITEKLRSLVAKYGIELPSDFGLNMFLTGKAVQRETLSGIEKRTVLLEARENTLTLLLREIVDILFYADNENGVKNVILMQESMTPELQQLVVAVINGLGDVHAQADGTDKVLGILYKVYSIGGTYFSTGSVANTVLDNWKTVVKMFLSADESYITDFIAAIYPQLCDYVKAETGTDIEDVVPAENLTFFMKIKAFFQRIIDFIKGLFIK